MSKQQSKSVFVGNIPYGLTEEQITDIFSSAGKVVSFRLVYDRETGRPKGFGFAEYPDHDSAASAVRNLNDFEIMNRKLRVDFSNDAGDDESAAPLNYTHPPPPPMNGIPVPPPLILPQSTTLPPLPTGIDLPPGLTCPDAISRTLNTLPPAQLLDVLSQMKSLVSNDQAQATELLRQAPQLSYAIFQALLLMGLVSTEALSTVVEQATAAPVPQVSLQAPTPQGYPPMPLPIPGQGGFPGGFPPPPPPQMGGIGTPPVGIPYPPPPQQYQAPQQRAAPQQPASDPATEALIAQVMSMPQSLIDQLPPAEREQLLSLRRSFGG